MKDRWFTGIRWVLLVFAVGDLAALKNGLWAHSHLILAGLMGLAMAAFVARGVQLIVLRVAGTRSGIQVYAGMVLAAGVALALGGGLANWTMGLQGYVILTEAETARLHDGSELQGFEAGPFGDVDELDVVVGLDELELTPAGADGFSPVSHLQVWRGHHQPVSLTLSPTAHGAAGSLRFYQGAFGFAPRIVILREGETKETLFDKVVPFLTERHGPRGIVFNGSFTVEQSDLRVEGMIRLDSLDEGMRGHATLELSVHAAGKTVGSGSLLPGHFADMDDGIRVGFAGLHKWSEIVLSRRSYGPFVLAGAILAAAGGLLHALSLGKRR